MIIQMSSRQNGKTEELRKHKMEVITKLLECDNMETHMFLSSEKGMYCILYVYYKNYSISFDITREMLDEIKTNDELVELENMFVKRVKYRAMKRSMGL